MSTILVASASVHTTAAACDYLSGRIEAGDRVIVLTVDESGMAARDAGDAGNVARARLPAATVETRTAAGDPAEEVSAAAAELDADEVVVGATRGDPAEAGEPPGETVRSLCADLDRPLVVLPAPAPGSG